MESAGTHPRFSPFETLPLHLFQYLCECVPRRSLSCLSSASRLCYQATTPRRFRRVKLTIRNKEKLRRDLDNLLAVLSSRDLFRHVHQVVAIGCMDHDGGSEDCSQTTDPATADQDSDDDSDSDSDNDDLFGATIGSGPPLSTQQKKAQNEAWLPFALFLGQLPALTDLVYACTHQLPPCVLAALHKYHPTSRLHVDAFSLRSLCQERHQLHDIDPDDFALATSPCLYNLRARCLPYDDWGRFNFNLEALEHIVASGCAPELRKLSIDHCSPSGSLALVEALRDPRRPWKGFFFSSQSQVVVSPQQQALTQGRGRLKTLVLSGSHGGLSHLQGWETRTEFGLLRKFEYHCKVSVESFQFLASLAASGSFRSLRILRLGIFDTAPGSDSGQLDQSAASFLQALPPLETLTLENYFGTHAVEAALSRHGPTLCKLRLLPEDGGEAHNDVDTDAARVREIQQRCPMLKDIELRVRRRQGGPEEVAVYQTLGRIPRLRRATLRLDCRSPYRDQTHDRNMHRGTLMFYDEPSGDAERVRNTLVNLALDETLATEIFRKIVSAAPDSPLERLTLEPQTEDTIAAQFPEIDSFGRWIGRSWALKICGKSGAVRAREIDVDRYDREYLRNNLEQVEYQGEDVWGTLWPNEGGDWRDDWHSFPLWCKENGNGGVGEKSRDGPELHGSTVTPS
ncbi:hypothetical protein CHGG_00136 [Chaetomium globosum CBS 148.51]|uniref:Uncharacterized protein n=1 Tax=Chaetomium globosum (strain ATCC 6205 / CBS 148.51 / DSM 1962 / NBRC 6347 / NRRL 1970) TaxID=306901 RepID=Q2HI18_CHAGB|nr:uncharacterized protein CHGG_00136 [Chaetomium globosum CBS 148.51]EAQ91901.1 hypothetical protein CHGG_00136 [Chaetomium globosum CBS 148.51]